MLSIMKRYRLLETVCALVLGVLGFVAFCKISAHWNFYWSFQHIILFAFASAILLLLFSGGNYYVVGLQAALTSLLSFGKIVFDTVYAHVSGLKPQISMNVLNGITAIMLCLIPYMLLLLSRLFAPFKFMNTDKKKRDFAIVFKIQSAIILIAYLSYFIINFITGRPLSGEERLNLIPFDTVKEYYLWFRYNERIEPVVLFLGNIFVFSPLGFYARILFPNIKKRYIILFPIVLSGSIEISQLILKNGHCDIDDFGMNCLGFYFGVWVKALCDGLRKKISKGEEDSVFPCIKKLR